MAYTLSKTDYILYRECPKNVWVKIHKPDLYYASELSEFEKAIIETGNEVDLVARELFPTGVLIEGRGEDAQKETQDYLAKGEETLFQPVFAKDGFLAALDILKFNAENNTFAVYEVKASNEVDDKVHYYDLAFQVNLLEQSGYKVEAANIIHLNSKYVRSGELDIIKLFQIENVTEVIKNLSADVMEEMERALEYISSETEPNGYCCCVYKGRSKHCTTFQYSNPAVPKYSVHDISRIGVSKAKLQELIDGNIFEIQNVPDDLKLSEIQRNQVDAHLFDKITIDKNKIAEEFENLEFPLYFLDYETYPCALPRFDGFSPYQQIPFQYSLYVLDSEDAEPKHFEFLHTASGDPSLDLATSLEKHIGGKGTVIVWNKKFECKINEELGQRIPAFKSFLDAVNARVYDLMDIFGKQYYVHKDFKGKISIKNILPVLVPELSYKKLEIQEGGTASQKWNELTTGDISPEDKTDIAKNLQEYCKLDTYAMYAIWKHLSELI